MKYERRLKFRETVLYKYGQDVLNIIECITEDDFHNILVYDPYGWNPYPELTPPNDELNNSQDVTHWLVQNEAGQMRSMTFSYKTGTDERYEGWKHPEFGVIAFRKLPETFKKE